MEEEKEWLIKSLKEDLENNGNKISYDFVAAVAKKSKVTHMLATSRTRVCVLTLPTGHEVVGYSQVLFDVNDVPEIGKQVAYKNAEDKIWDVLGAIALSLNL